jgi:hypothetical protein
LDLKDGGDICLRNVGWLSTDCTELYLRTFWLEYMKSPLLIRSRRWEHNIKMYLRELDCEETEWLQLAWYKVQWWGPVRLQRIFGFHKTQII